MNVATSPLIRFTFLSIITGLVTLLPAYAQGKKLSNPTNEAKPIDTEKINTLSPTGQSNNILSIEGGDRLMKEAAQAVASQDYPLAVKKLQEARQVYNQLSGFYQQFLIVDVPHQTRKRELGVMRHDRASLEKRDRHSLKKRDRLL